MPIEPSLPRALINSTPLSLRNALFTFINEIIRLFSKCPICCGKFVLDSHRSNRWGACLPFLAYQGYPFANYCNMTMRRTKNGGDNQESVISGELGRGRIAFLPLFR